MDNANGARAPATPTGDTFGLFARVAAEGLAPNAERFLDFVCYGEGEAIELQALNVPSGGSFKVNRFAHATSRASVVRLLAEADKWNAPGVYFLLNAIDPAVATRAVTDTWHRMEKGGSTTDGNIVARRALYLDFDVIRPTGTSATDDQVRAALAVAGAVNDRLAAHLGGDRALALGMSGNGASLFIALDRILESPELAATVKELLAAIGALHSCATVGVDSTVCDAKRLCPAFGTVKQKGAPGLPERPHRRTAIVVPPVVRRLTMEELGALRDALRGDLRVEQRAAVDKSMGRRAAADPKAPKAGATTPTTSATPKDPAWEMANGVDIRDLFGRLGLLDGDAPICPGCREGGPGDSSRAFVGNCFKCSHDRCASRGKGGFRTSVDAVMESREVSAPDAVNWLAGEYVFKPLAPRATATVERHQTDAGNGALYATMHAESLRYVVETGSWIAWAGARWKPATQGELRRAALATARRLLEEAAHVDNPDARKAAVKWALGSEGIARQDAMIVAASAVVEMEISVAKLDADPMLLAVENGTIDLRTGGLRAHRRDDLITRWTPIRFAPAATAPRWGKFLSEIFAGDDNLIGFMQRAIGYVLTGSTEEHALLLFHGSGANGKSVLISVLRALLGDFATVATIETFLTSKRTAGSASPDLVALAGARMVVAQESEAGAKLAEATIKTLTGSDEISARQLFGKQFTYLPQFKLIIATNHRPNIKGTDDAIWRRVRLVPFGVSFLGREDHGLTTALLAELPGILAWAVDGCVEWQRHGLGNSEAVARATAAYRGESDTIGGFVGDSLAIGPDLRISRVDLLRVYVAWCAEVGETAVAPSTLYSAIGERPSIVATKTAGSRGFRGIGEAQR